MHWRGGGGGGRDVDDKLVYVNIVCSEAGCYSLIMKCICLGLTCERAL